MNNIERYLIPANGLEIEPIKIGFELLSKIINKYDRIEEVVLLIPSKHQLEEHTLTEVLDSKTIKKLKKEGYINLTNTLKLKVKTEKTFRSLLNPHILYGIYVTQKMLDQIDSSKKAVAIIVVPWQNKEVEEWKRTWNPIVLGEEQSEKEKLIDNPVVEEALKSLTNLVNLSTGLIHPSDKSAAIERFKILQRNREYYDPISIRSWAVRNGWTPEGANQLKDIAQGVLERKRYRKQSTPHWKKDIIDYFRSKATEK